MFRRNQLIGAAALALACSLPASAAVAQQDLRNPDQRFPAAAGEQQDLRNPDQRFPAAAGERQVPAPGSSVAARGGEGYPPGVFTEREREIVRDYQGTPEYERSLLQSQLERLARDAGAATLEVPSGGFDWGDAGIGAAGMLALFSIAAGSTLLLTNRRRSRGLQVTAP
jgi:hypothetical protein